LTRLHERFPALRDALPRVALGEGPTPVRPLPGLREGLWLKDESPYGTAWGGNKVRKLEWILPDAKRRGKRTILTFGALGTNHGLATALYAREQGLRCAIALIDQPMDDHVRAQLARLEASGAALHRTHAKARTAAAMPWLLARHRMPYVLPAGGSSPVGALGYVEAAFEIAAQVEAGELPEPSHVVVAVGSGGTAAGLTLGLRLAGLDTKVLGVVVNDTLKLDHRTLLRLAGKTARLLRERGAGVPDPDHGDLIVTRDQLGPGYGHPTPDSEAALERAGTEERLSLDPVYTAKAMAAALAFDAPGPLLFLNTHGPR
jgi:D-cysteine desulfhydrase